MRNTRDGKVEAVVQGPDAAVGALIAWARKGPPLARVERVEIGSAEGEYRGFEKRSD